MKTKIGSSFGCTLIAALALNLVTVGFSQSTKLAQSHPAHLPYAFSNFAWWSNDELRALLTKRMPGLKDEIAPTAEAEARVREALKALLKEKGILAEVQSEEPSAFSLTGERAPGAPAPAIVFSILSPEILVNKVVISQAPDSLISALNETLRPREGRGYSARQDLVGALNCKRGIGLKRIFGVSRGRRP